MLQNKDGEQKYFNLCGRYSLILLISSTFTLLGAGSFADFKRVQTESFKKYKEEQDTEFSKYLQSEWQEFQAQKPDSLYEVPKPQVILPAEPKKAEAIGPKIFIELKTPKEALPLIAIPQSGEKNLSFEFYGSSFGLSVPNGLDKAIFTPQTQTGIANFFDTLVTSEYATIVQEIAALAKSLQLNDWGTYQLVLKVSEKLYPNENEAKLMSWFLFNKLGYSVKVALSNKNVVLMHYAEKTIYAIPHYTIDAKKYYIFSASTPNSLRSLYTYKQTHPDAQKPLDLALNTLPLLSENIKSKTIAFTHEQNAYSIEYVYNQNLIDFMASYPQADYETFFNAPIEQRSYEAIATALKKHIDNKKASEAMNFVLTFVQNAFKYKTDTEQFGMEKVMFAQETLYFDTSDCEDRAVLFAYLIKELFGVGVVGVKYKDHMATALYIPMEGDSLRYGSKKYIIADPTYVNASIGESMPKYRPLKPERFILVSSSTKRLQ